MPYVISSLEALSTNVNKITAGVTAHIRIIVHPTPKPVGGSFRFDPSVVGLGVVILVALIGWLL